MKITIVLADDHKIVRVGLKNLLNDEDGMEVIDEAENGREVLEIVKKKKPDVIIMDIGMPELNGIEAAKKVGELIAEACKSNSIDTVIFDRGNSVYQGRVAALADSARSAGIVF